MMPSYFTPRRTSRATYLRASSTIQRMGLSAMPDSSAFSRAQATDFFEALDAFATERAEVVIDCRGLRRLDFVAAGELLNHLVALRTGGKYVVFRDVNQLVAALMAVMGIHDLAELRLRRP